METELKTFEEQRDDAVSIIEAIDDATGNQGGWFSFEIFLMMLVIAFRYVLPRLDAFVKLWFDKRQEAKTENWQQIVRLYDILNNLKEEIECDRILLMYTCNGGGIPKPGSQVFATALHGVGDDAADEIKRWHKLPIDEAYVSTLYALCNNRTILLSRDDLADGALKTTYKRRKIRYSIVSNVHSDRKRYYYLTCNFKGGLFSKRLTATQLERKRSSVEAACTKLAEILKD